MQAHDIDYRTQTATEADILAHLRECAGSYVPPLDQRVDLAEYARKLAARAVKFEAWKERWLVGLVAAYFDGNAGRLAYITDVSVQGNYRGLGIASELLTRCSEHARKLGCETVQLEVGKASGRAVALYSRFGFVADALKGDVMKMSLRLAK